MSNSKLALKPSEGIYYVVPHKSGSPVVLSEREDQSADPAHMFFWEKALKGMARDFGFSSGEVRDLTPRYMGIPRGRVQKEIDYDTLQPTGGYVVFHGGDMPLDAIRNFVYQDFGLRPLAGAGKVVWKVEPHEKMDPADRKAVLDVLKKHRGT